MPPVRWTMILMCCLANTINYIDRANLAVAAPIMQRELGFDAATMGFILGGFFWTYAFMQMPFGWALVQKSAVRGLGSSSGGVYGTALSAPDA